MLKLIIKVFREMRDYLTGKDIEDIFADKNPYSWAFVQEDLDKLRMKVDRAYNRDKKDG